MYYSGDEISVIFISTLELIKSHKQASQPSGSKRQVSAMQYSKGYNRKSFSWQRNKQSAKEKQQVVGQSLSYVQNQASVAKSSFSLDRRKAAGSSSGMINVFANIFFNRRAHYKSTLV